MFLGICVGLRLVYSWCTLGILGVLWTHFWEYYVITLGVLEMYFGCTLGGLWAHFGRIVGIRWVYFGFTLKYFGCTSVVLGCTCGCTCGDTWKVLFRVLLGVFGGYMGVLLLEHFGAPQVAITPKLGALFVMRLTCLTLNCHWFDIP